MKKDFLRIYGNLPIPERSMPIYVDKLKKYPKHTWK